MSDAEARHRLHRALGAGAPPHGLTTRALAGIGGRGTADAHRGWALGLAVAAMLFAIVTGSTLAVRGLHSSPRAARPAPTAPVIAVVPSSSALAGGGQLTGPPASAPAAASNASYASPSPGAGRDCTSADLSLTTYAGTRPYAYGQSIGLTSMAQNISSTPCVVRVTCGSRIQVFDSAGNAVYSYPPAPMASCALQTAQTLAPAGTTLLTSSWDQQTCSASGPCSGPVQASPGSYSARGDWDFVMSSGEHYLQASAATFTIEGPPQCSASDAVLTVSTDKSSYAAGATITAIATVTNHSSRPCSIASGNAAFTYYISNSTMGTVWVSCGNPPQPCSTPPTQRILAHGASYSMTAAWNQQNCRRTTGPCTQVAPGTYTLAVDYGYSEAQDNFTITAT